MKYWSIIKDSGWGHRPKSLFNGKPQWERRMVLKPKFDSRFRAPRLFITVYQDETYPEPGEWYWQIDAAFFGYLAGRESGGDPVTKAKSEAMKVVDSKRIIEYFERE